MVERDLHGSTRDGEQPSNNQQVEPVAKIQPQGECKYSFCSNPVYVIAEERCEECIRKDESE